MIVRISNETHNLLYNSDKLEKRDVAQETRVNFMYHVSSVLCFMHVLITFIVGKVFLKCSYIIEFNIKYN